MTQHTDDLPVDKPVTRDVPKGALNTEPAGTVGTTISAILVALFAVLRAFDVGVTDDMSNSLTAFVLALCAVPAVSGWLTRIFTWSPASVQREANASAMSGVASKVTADAGSVPESRWGVNNQGSPTV